jgi:hypothetical protein
VPSAEVGECGVDFKTGLYDSCGFFYTYHFSFEAYFQARSGFGKFSNGLNLQWQDAIADGMPLPILEIQSAFIVDGEKIRWQRRYIKAAYGTFVCLWWAATMWILANITGIMWLTSTLAAEKVGVSAQLDDIVYKTFRIHLVGLLLVHHWHLLRFSAGLPHLGKRPPWQLSLHRVRGRLHGHQPWLDLGPFHGGKACSSLVTCCSCFKS